MLFALTLGICTAITLFCMSYRTYTLFLQKTHTLPSRNPHNKHPSPHQTKPHNTLTPNDPDNTNTDHNNGNNHDDNHGNSDEVLLPDECDPDLDESDPDLVASGPDNHDDKNGDDHDDDHGNSDEVLLPDECDPDLVASGPDNHNDKNSNDHDNCNTLAGQYPPQPNHKTRTTHERAKTLPNTLETGCRLDTSAPQSPTATVRTFRSGACANSERMGVFGVHNRSECHRGRRSRSRHMETNNRLHAPHAIQLLGYPVL